MWSWGPGDPPGVLRKGMKHGAHHSTRHQGEGLGIQEHRPGHSGHPSKNLEAPRAIPADRVPTTILRPEIGMAQEIEKYFEARVKPETIRTKARRMQSGSNDPPETSGQDDSGNTENQTSNEKSNGGSI